MNRVERLTATLLLLQEKPRTAAEIAAAFEISRRTVLRDIQALSEMGVPVIAREGPGGGYWLPESYSLDPPALSANESFLLLLALKGIEGLSAAPYAAERASLAAKLRALLPPEQLARLEPLLARVAQPAAARSQRAPFLEALLDALAAEGWLLLTYQSAGGQSQAHIKPLHIDPRGGLWYCRAYAYEAGAERTYRVDRMLRLEAPAADFGNPPAAAGKPYNHPSHPLVQVRLTALGARLLEAEEHLAPNLQPGPDGAYLEFRCPPDELAYYARLFAGLGAQAQVQGPPELIRRLADLGAQLNEQYPPR